MKTHATAVFHQPPENYNCAQAVLDAFQQKTGRTISEVSAFKAFGGGRAPDNECGALYAACQAAPEAAAELRREFEARAGSTRCKVLKGELRFPCRECVGLAADLLQSRCKK